MATKTPAIEKIGAVTSKSLLKHTGKDWDFWLKVLKQNGAVHWTHKEIVAFLKKKYKLQPWWQQMITSAYEIHIGRRVQGANVKGEFFVTATKSLRVGRKKLWDFMNSEEGLALWLQPMSPLLLKPKNQYEARGGIFGEIRTMKAPVRVRLTWQDSDWDKATVVQVYLVDRPAQKSILVISHEKLPSPRSREKMRAHWKAVLEEVAKTLA